MQILKIEFLDDFSPKYEEYYEKFQEIFQKTLKELNKQKLNYFVEVNIVGEEEIHYINKEYRAVDSVTDVLSFPLEDETPVVLDETEVAFIHLGSIMICAPRALEQSANYGHSLDRELKFLFVHGLLHLLGYDHMDAESEKVMFELQNKIIGKRGSDDE